MDGTIIRIVGSIKWHPTVVNLDVFARFGLVVMDEDARSAGAVPDPWADPTQWLWEETDWMIVDSVQESHQFNRFDLNIRAMRKLPEFRSSLVLVVENLAASGAILAYFLGIKVLVAHRG